MKYFCWNIDDGLEQDKRITAILASYGMGATFNLNSGLMGTRQVTSRIGDYGIKDSDYSEFSTRRLHLLPWAEEFRIPADEVADVYRGFEVASHSRTHRRLSKLTGSQLEQEIAGDVTALSKIFGTQVRGFAYPFGAVSDECVGILKAAGVRYARTVRQDRSFAFPKDPWRMPMTCWFFQRDMISQIDRFAQLETEDDALFILFAHGYEFDFNTKRANWDTLKRICEHALAYDGIEFCSTGEAFAAHDRTQVIP